jgi:hypothetical protein
MIERPPQEPEQDRCYADWASVYDMIDGQSNLHERQLLEFTDAANSMLSNMPGLEQCIWAAVQEDTHVFSRNDQQVAFERLLPSDRWLTGQLTHLAFEKNSADCKGSVFAYITDPDSKSKYAVLVASQNMQEPSTNSIYELKEPTLHTGIVRNIDDERKQDKWDSYVMTTTAWFEAAPKNILTGREWMNYIQELRGHGLDLDEYQTAINLCLNDQGDDRLRINSFFSGWAMIMRNKPQAVAAPTGHTSFKTELPLVAVTFAVDAQGELVAFAYRKNEIDNNTESVPMNDEGLVFRPRA